MDLVINANKLQYDSAKLLTLTEIALKICGKQLDVVFSYPDAPHPICQHLYPDLAGSGCGGCHGAEIPADFADSLSGFTHKCFSGLYSTFLPIIHNGSVIGYAQLGPYLPDHANVKKALAQIEKRLGRTPAALEGLSRLYYSLKKIGADRLDAAIHLVGIYGEYAVAKGYISNLNSNFSPQLLPVVTYITQNIAGELNADTLSGQLFISKNSLYQLAREETGLSLGQFIRKQRLSYAEKLLASTDYSVTKIADLCGIHDFNYFSRLFKRQTGLTPLQFRGQSLT